MIEWTRDVWMWYLRQEQDKQEKPPGQGTCRESRQLLDTRIERPVCQSIADGGIRSQRIERPKIGLQRS